MHITAVHWELLIPHVHSLKEKRRLRLRILDRVRNRFNVSIIESDMQDRLDVLHLAASVVAFGPASAEETLQGISDAIFRWTGLETVVIGESACELP